MIRHARKQHPEHFAADGSCVEDCLDAKGTKQIRFFRALAKLAAPNGRERVLDLFQGGGYTFLVTKVWNNIGHDLLDVPRTAARDLAQQTYLEACHAPGNAGNQLRHALAQDVAKRILVRELWKPGAKDAGGGRPLHGFVLETHGGLFAPSLDRVDNRKDPFLVGQGTFANIVLLSAGMNTSANIVADGYQENTAARVKEEMERSVDPAEKAAVKAREEKSGERVDGKWVNNALYASCNSIFNKKKDGQYHDPAGRAYFGTADAFYEFMLSILIAQGALCVVSGILLRGVRSEFPWYQRIIKGIVPQARATSQASLRYRGVCSSTTGTLAR